MSNAIDIQRKRVMSGSSNFAHAVAQELAFLPDNVQPAGTARNAMHACLGLHPACERMRRPSRCQPTYLLVHTLCVTPYGPVAATDTVCTAVLIDIGV